MAKGFTLIELLIVISIIGVLAAVAVPAYTNYLMRARVSEALVLAAPLKKSIEEHYVHNGRLPHDNATAGLLPAQHYQGHYVERISVADGRITVLLAGNGALAGQALDFAPAINPEYPYRISRWYCGRAASDSQTTLDYKYLPSTCK